MKLLIRFGVPAGAYIITCIILGFLIVITGECASKLDSPY